MYQLLLKMQKLF